MPCICCFPDGIYSFPLWGALPGSSHIIQTLVKCESFTNLVYRTWILVQCLLRALISWNIPMRRTGDSGKSQTVPILYKFPRDNHITGPTHLTRILDSTLKGPSTCWTRVVCLIQRKGRVIEREVWQGRGIKHTPESEGTANTQENSWGGAESRLASSWATLCCVEYQLASCFKLWTTPL